MSSRVQDRSRKNTSKSSQQSKSGSWKRAFTNDGSNDSEEEADENTQCIICAEKITYASKSPCNHTTCHKCMFRQKALYNKSACLVCRTEDQKLIFTELLDKSYDELNPGSIVVFNEKFNIGFTSQYAHDDTLNLLSYKCQLCGIIEKDSKSLGTHLKNEHERLICNVCADHNRSFPSELKVFSHKQLQAHQTRGDEKGFHGHPLCPFCKSQRFYSDDELKLHLRQNHERCHVCDKLDPSNPQYFKNYDSLEEHFKTDHFRCTVQACLDKKFIVFGDELDLQSHMLQEHGGIYGKNYVVGATSNNRYQSQLSTFRPINNSRNNNNTKNKSAANQDGDSADTKKMRLEERARHYLNYSTSGFKEFTDLNTSYKNGKIDIFALQKAYKKLFKDKTDEEIHFLFYDLSEIYPKSTPQGLELASIVESHDRKLKEEQDFPALPGSSSSLNLYGGSWNNNSGSKKKSNSQRREEDFPALPSVKSKTPGYAPVKTTVRYKTVIHQKQTAPVTVNNTKSTYVPNYLSTIPKPSSTVKKAAPLDENLFPSLPKPAPKRVIPRVNAVPQGNGAWDVGSSSSASASASSSSLNLAGMDDSLPVVTKGKGKKKKQILFQMGGK